MTGSSYRTDIDGLRAFAVLFVTVFHINEALVPGGFIGVDMFFVISGYLITGIVARDRAAGTFTYAEFYRRRIKRIFPAMLLVTAVTLLAGLLLMLPEDVLALAWSALATILSAANIYFAYFLDTSYFAPDSATVPLLHMWSLGVEEQFYLFWPALLLALLKWPRLVVPALLVLIAASVALGEWMLAEERFAWAYYMLPTRAFQLATGGLLVFLPAALAPAGGRAATALALAGAALCLASAALLSGQTLYPGVNALPVTAGTALLILGGTRANPLSRALSWAPLRWFGLISYSLYLWHWPVLAFQRYFHDELSATQQAGSFVVMVALAWLSYRYVEKPARASELPLRAIALRMGLAPMAAACAAIAYLIATAGYGPWPKSRFDLVTAEPAFRAEFVCQSSRLKESDTRTQRCVVGPDGQAPRILLWGDSNASHYVGAIKAIAERDGFAFRNIAHSACPSLVDGPERFVGPQTREACRTSSALVHAILPHYDGIILSSSWDSYIAREREFLAALDATVAALVADGKTVLLLGRIPRLRGFDASCFRKAVKLPFLSCEVATATLASVERTNAAIRDLATRRGALYADFSAILCPDGLCTDRVDGVSVYLDPGHLSRSGSEILGNAALDTEAVRPFSTLRSLVR